MTCNPIDPFKNDAFWPVTCFDPRPELDPTRTRPNPPVLPCLSEMVIYAFLLGFFSPSLQKEWFKIWKIRDQPNHTNHIKEPQNSHCLVVHDDDHLSYKWYKVGKLCFKCHPRYTSTSIHKHTLFFVFFLFSPFFY